MNQASAAHIPEATCSRLRLEPADNERLNRLCGPADRHLRQLERYSGILIENRGHDFRLKGHTTAVARVEATLRSLYENTCGETISASQVFLALRESELHPESPPKADAEADAETGAEGLRGTCGWVQGRTHNQLLYLRRIRRHHLNFGVGPAGTGKTYLAVVAAITALRESRVRRIILVRPAVEAGEHLGFLPGDLGQKVDPYLRPLYDALYELLGAEQCTRLQEQGTIEIAPLAFMRGRTLSNAFVILDEAQNTTHRQMKMFLTRLGFGSTAVITGDLTQVDLADRRQSGLDHALQVLRSLGHVSFTFFEKRDVLRHPLVTQIVEAYEGWEGRDTAHD